MQEHRPAAQVLREFMRAYVNEARERQNAPANNAISAAERRRREDAANFARASVGLEGFKLSREIEAQARRFSSTLDPEQPAPIRIEGFQAVGDIFGSLLPQAAPAKVLEAPPATKVGRAGKARHGPQNGPQRDQKTRGGNVGRVVAHGGSLRLPQRRFDPHDDDGAPEGLALWYPARLLLTWVCTEVAQKRERVLSLGNNLASYLDELGLRSTGGKRGDITCLKHAMAPLFSSIISCHYEGKNSFALQNVLLADSVDWWTPQNPEEAGEWQAGRTGTCRTSWPMG